ncbi:exonuclease SbcCD subunit D C-terminal domain-containing protein, partial [Paenibacillus favisporus]
QAKSVSIIDVAPGQQPVMEEVYLSCGRPLIRWKAKGGLEEVHRWLDEGRDANGFIDLEISLTEAMSLGDIHRLRKSHEGFVHIRPVYPEMEQVEVEYSRSSLPVPELFRKFYQRQTGGAEPDDALVELFLALTSEDAEVKEEA